MANLAIRSLDDDLKPSLRAQVARHGQSMEEEVRSILRQASSSPIPVTGLGQRLANRFQSVAAVLPVPPRSLPRIPLDWEDDSARFCLIPTFGSSSCG